ncbi:hypothetical protein GCM10010182_83440 [Actinomadura cremea]|nr:hypothetical protein GCM10010182_83440 [Actinomadura cremea]
MAAGYSSASAPRTIPAALDTPSQPRDMLAVVLRTACASAMASFTSVYAPKSSTRAQTVIPGYIYATMPNRTANVLCSVSTYQWRAIRSNMPAFST